MYYTHPFCLVYILLLVHARTQLYGHARTHTHTHWRTRTSYFGWNQFIEVPASSTELPLSFPFSLSAYPSICLAVGWFLVSSKDICLVVSVYAYTCFCTCRSIITCRDGYEIFTLLLGYIGASVTNHNIAAWRCSEKHYLLYDNAIIRWKWNYANGHCDLP